MQFADTVIDQLWEVWRISQVDKCEKVCTGDLGMGVHGPLHTHTSLECELWPLQVLRQISEVHLYSCNAETSRLDEKTSWGKRIVCLQNTYPYVQFNPTNHYIYIANRIDTWHVTPFCKHISDFLLLLQWSQTVHSIGIPVCYKVEQSVKKASFVHIFKEQPLELKSQCLFQRSSNEK